MQGVIHVVGVNLSPHITSYPSSWEIRGPGGSLYVMLFITLTKWDASIATEIIYTSNVTNTSSEISKYSYTHLKKYIIKYRLR